MSEIKGEYRPVTPIQNYNPKPMSVADYASPIVRCEDCPAAKVCKKIDNFRASCDAKSGKSATVNTEEKCMAGTNILLFKILEALTLKG